MFKILAGIGIVVRPLCVALLTGRFARAKELWCDVLLWRTVGWLCKAFLCSAWLAVQLFALEALHGAKVMLERLVRFGR